MLGGYLPAALPGHELDLALCAPAKTRMEGIIPISEWEKSFCEKKTLKTGANECPSLLLQVTGTSSEPRRRS